jgi:hypothetical protein
MSDQDTEPKTPAAPKARKPRAPKSKALPQVVASSTDAQQLGFWPDQVRGVPNAALRGALFSINQEREVAKKRQKLATVDGYQIIFKGERFNQRDLDLWEMLLHIGRQQRFGKQIEFVASDLLKALGRDTGGGDYEELKEDMARLKGGAVEVLFTDINQTFSGGLIQNFYRDETTQRYAVVFDDKMLKLYDAGYTHVDWEQRRKLKGNNLAQWLHGFYATHAAPLRYKVATLRELCGSTAGVASGRLTDFRKPLRVALDRLKDIKAITDWSIDPKTDLVTVRRKGTKSQQRYLENKQAAGADAEFSSGVTGTLSGFDSH